MAKGLWERPLRPYDFLADDAGPGNAGWERGQPPRMVNPPAHHYLMALFLKAGGGRVWAARVGGLFLSGLSAVFLYLLAQRFLVLPGPAAALAVLTPAFWLSSYSLLIDATLLAFFLGALWSWIEGLKRRSKAFLFLSGVLMGLTLLVKYTGGFVVLLALLYWVMEKKEERSLSSLLFLLIPAAFLALWSFWNIATYGAPHLTESSKRVLQTFDVSHVLTFLVFFSGVFLTPLIAWPLSFRRAPKLLAVTLVLSLGLAAVLSGPRGGFPVGQALLMVFLAAGSALFFFQTFQISRSDGFLVLWLALGTAQMIYIMQWVAARYYLTLLAPVIFLTGRLLQARYRHAPSALSRAQILLGIGMFFFSLSLAWVDYKQAGTNRLIAEELGQVEWNGQRRFYSGDSFTGSYLKDLGWETLFEDTALRPGDLVLLREVTMPPWWMSRRKERFEKLKVFEYPCRFPLRVMDNHGSAGFYASAWGALPFSFSKSPLERFTLLRVRQSVDLQGPQGK
jgi:4-amino-4-deoxy-L-arabinose transferase-like glycosyltransferase